MPGMKPLSECLLINSDIPGIDNVIAQLAQPEFFEDQAGHTQIDKQPQGTDSPDAHDAVILAYYHDLEDGSFVMPKGFL